MTFLAMVDDCEREDAHPLAECSRRGDAVTVMPGIYGDDLSEPAKVAYARWMMSLFKLCEHVDTCPYDCEDEDVICPEGRPYRDVEQERHREWRAVRDAEVTP